MDMENLNNTINTQVLMDITTIKYTQCRIIFRVLNIYKQNAWPWSWPQQIPKDQIIRSIFSDNNAINTEKNYKKKTRNTHMFGN